DTDTLRIGANFTSTADAQIANIENLVLTAAGTTLDVSNQTEGFDITGSGGVDSIAGGAGADTISAGVGNDTIVGFVGADSVDGGAGTDTITLSATSADLNDAANADITNVEAVDASGAAAGVTIDLSNQTEGFTITGSGFADDITGGGGADTISAGAGNDTIHGFTSGESVDGGNNTDTIALTATSTALNGAGDAAITNVEAVDASGAAAGVTIDLHNQTEAFTITGSDFGDTLTGTAAADTINAGDGDDTIVGFAGADAVDGGNGTDTSTLSATS